MFRRLQTNNSKTGQKINCLVSVHASGNRRPLAHAARADRQNCGVGSSTAQAPAAVLRSVCAQFAATRIGRAACRRARWSAVIRARPARCLSQVQLRQSGHRRIGALRLGLLESHALSKSSRCCACTAQARCDSIAFITVDADVKKFLTTLVWLAAYPGSNWLVGRCCGTNKRRPTRLTLMHRSISCQSHRTTVRSAHRLVIG